MKLSIRVKPKSHTDSVETIDETHFTIRVRAKPHNGKANEAALKLLSRHLDVPLSLLAIHSGHASRNKIVEIHDPR